MQRVLIVSTQSANMRSAIEGWTHENGNALMEAIFDRQRRQGATQYDRLDIPVGLIGGSLQFPKYPTVLHAIGDGWKLLAPPAQYQASYATMYEWWLVKEG